MPRTKTTYTAKRTVGVTGNIHPETDRRQDIVEQLYRALTVVDRQVTRTRRNAVAQFYCPSDKLAVAATQLRTQVDDLHTALWTESNGTHRAFRRQPKETKEILPRPDR